MNSAPDQLRDIIADTAGSGFTMPSDILTGALLSSLAASKPAGRILELGTGTGLASSWLLHGMDSNSTLDSVDNDENVMAIAIKHLSGRRSFLPSPHRWC